jgi:hypothetical protein
MKRLQSVKICNAKGESQYRGRRERCSLQSGHPFPSGKAGRQTAKGNVEQFRAVVRAHEARKPLWGCHGKRTGANCARMSGFDEPLDKLGARRNDYPGTRTARF